MMSKFRKKPVVIEAEQYRVGHDLPFVELSVLDYNEDTRQQFIRTLEGDMVVSDGDWVIKGVKGEFYPCKPDIFAATYEPVSAGEEVSAAQLGATALAVTMPPPTDRDWQVSHVDGPDYDPRQFSGGVERITRENGLLVFWFHAGGKVSINHGVTYVAPEEH